MISGLQHPNISKAMQQQLNNGSRFLTSLERVRSGNDSIYASGNDVGPSRNVVITGVFQSGGGGGIGARKRAWSWPMDWSPLCDFGACSWKLSDTKWCSHIYIAIKEVTSWLCISSFERSKECEEIWILRLGVTYSTTSRTCHSSLNAAVSLEAFRRQQPARTKDPSSSSAKVWAPVHSSRRLDGQSPSSNHGRRCLLAQPQAYPFLSWLTHNLLLQIYELELCLRSTCGT